jgi:glycosyltransferase involved in cell wall biosynthesis
MRILYHHRTLADGAEGIHIQEMVDAFRELGHTVEMQALAKPAARGSGHSGLLSKIRAGLPPLLYEAAALGYNAAEYRRTRALLKQVRPDFVYKRHALFDLGTILAARAAKIPIVLEVNRPYAAKSYSVFEPITFARTAARFERVAFDAATVIAVVSTPLKQFVLGLGIPEEKILLTPNGANPVRFKADREAGRAIRRRFGFDDTTTVVGWVGILREWHRLELLIEALAELPATRLMIIGDGPDQARLEAVAAARGVTSSVLFTGRVRHDDMPAHIAALDVAVASDDRTGFASPMKILEYMAMAKPVVAPRMANIEDLIADGEDGLLFGPGNTGELLSALRRLQDDSQLRDRLGAAAREKVERERNWHSNVHAVIDRLSRRTARTPTP